MTAATIALAVIFAATGLFALAAAVAGWEWFFESYNVKILSGSLSRRSARRLYAVLGLAITVMGVYTFITALK